MMLPEHIKTELEEVKRQLELMRALATRSGFFKLYFKELGRKENGTNAHRTNTECFDYLNTQYFDFFGEYKYASYGSFCNSYNNYLRTK